ncbi:glucuronyl hydrolase [Streptococcus pneumoniae]|nr:glucuronyl hydrolase [Streptococcus pneumoniae]CVU24489.1 glucuronyl hydrolase [Streptococcus pneumoniae]CVX16379.1 glucuronyl hydrolase [Streptococcus pneumoniae]CWB43026.1 glucuronyl hydrolase [Streptococcus pneumoniae]CWD77659.1 glucuronyl hydrolase [Streptococcus pneumoniae]
MKIVLVGHGHFATGIYSSLQLIAGNQENVEAIDFVEGMSADELKQKILLAISNEEEVLILSDLLGGSPFKVSSTIMGENPAKTMNVLSGLNLAMLMEAVFARMAHSFDEVVNKSVVAAQGGVVNGKELFSTDAEEEEEDFPTPATFDNVYPIMDNTEWTNGFWTGELWLAYEYSQQDAFKNIAHKNVLSFLDRVNKRVELDHHDLGFLYTPSCMAEYKINGDGETREATLKAADKLIERYQEKGGFIQAWGDLGKKEHYRLIIDCLLNIQLLFFAYQETGDQKYYDIAESHFYASANNVIRDDASSFHTFYFDPETGQPFKGVTRQGYSDDSCWARGQSWGVYGIPLTYRHLKDESCFDLFKGVTNYFLNRLPKDHVSYWDLIFNDGSDQSRDSSATAIAVCGIHEMLKHLPEVDADKDIYKHAMHAMLRSLIEHYANDQFTPGGTSLLHGVYSWHSGKGVDEGNIWGDYYYLEALIRFYKDWNLYW